MTKFRTCESVKDNFILICWFISSLSETLSRRITDYVYDEIVMILGAEDVLELDQTSKRDLRLTFPLIDALLISQGQPYTQF